MIGPKQRKGQEHTAYTTSEDFCRIFKEDADRLYLLSFLLTGDHATAEKCFVQGLGDAVEGSPVFKEWAQSWARRTIIRNAIRMIQPRPTDGSGAISRSDDASSAATGPAEIAAVVALPVFERFVFVMTVLEGYSNQECSLLLGCTRAEVNAAREEALRRLGRSAEIRRKLAGVDEPVSIFSNQVSSKQAPPAKSESTIRLGAILPLAATA